MHLVISNNTENKFKLCLKVIYIGFQVCFKKLKHMFRIDSVRYLSVLLPLFNLGTTYFVFLFCTNFGLSDTENTKMSMYTYGI